MSRLVTDVFVSLQDHELDGKLVQLELALLTATREYDRAEAIGLHHRDCNIARQNISHIQKQIYELKRRCAHRDQKARYAVERQLTTDSVLAERSRSYQARLKEEQETAKREHSEASSKWAADEGKRTIEAHLGPIETSNEELFVLRYDKFIRDNVSVLMSDINDAGNRYEDRDEKHAAIIEAIAKLHKTVSKVL